MDCSYCLVKKEKKTETLEGGFPSEVFSQLLASEPIKSVAFCGGEPLLLTPWIQAITGFLMEYYPDIVRSIATNGILLTPSLAKWCNQTNTLVTLSLNGIEGVEKSLKELVEKSDNSDIVSTINSLHTLSIRKIIMPGEEFAASVVALAMTFPTAKIELSFDYTQLDKYKIDELWVFTKEVEKLRLVSGEIRCRLQFNNFIEEPCICSGKATLHPDGTIEPLCERHGILADTTPFGCTFVSQNMGTHLYTLYKRITDSLLYESHSRNLSDSDKS